MSTASRQKPPSLPSTASLNPTSSVRSFRRPPPPVTTVVTSPPWARDEPPSPKEDAASTAEPQNVSEPRPSDVASYSSGPSQSDSRWWTFTLPRSRDPSFNLISNSSRPEKKGFKDRSMSWLPMSASIREGTSFMRRDKEKDPEQPDYSANNVGELSVTVPPPAPFTMAHSDTPGWSSPWTPRIADSTLRRENSYGFAEVEQESKNDGSPWRLRRKKLRSFILVNTYVPLLFRFINISFTGAALGMAIRIRQLELRNNAMGAVGSSPTVVIIFAPLTLVHVIGAIYLEYFGRPLGLWRTSAKLAHTLSEVLFICAWSAALSLCFDNFFTSLIPCAPSSSTSWYNQLPRPPSNVETFEGSVGDRICDDQLSLICLVGVGLIAYCSNLIISLYRIFEKVKYHPAAAMRTS
ncbi:hypothetical protein BDQ12DRAFT_420851 [Crucibulum laeve]|uniref:Uncharacterized protein n=1 Tax=Crucibulum laeve TaxID=68775 RepID=A0A5C3M8N0_9AGAR|nr:hypothetical protein BDQ12DRAFT_420851 [Crucibulum laeve]